jgi:hypothetical protein
MALIGATLVVAIAAISPHEIAVREAGRASARPFHS